MSPGIVSTYRKPRYAIRDVVWALGVLGSGIVTTVDEVNDRVSVLIGGVTYVRASAHVSRDGPVLEVVGKSVAQELAAAIRAMEDE